MNKTKEYRISQRMRKRIEELFGEAKEYMGLRVAKFRRMKFVREQVLMTASAQNIKRMVKLLSARGPKQKAFAVTNTIGVFWVKVLQISVCLGMNIMKNIFDDRNCLIET